MKPLPPPGLVVRFQKPALFRTRSVAGDLFDYTAGREQLLTDMYRAVLASATYSPAQNFFAAGGDSLSAFRVVKVGWGGRWRVGAVQQRCVTYCVGVEGAHCSYALQGVREALGLGMHAQVRGKSL
jgi:hypothetical protein